MRLKDKVVAVTASSRGIGLAAARACAQEGAVVFFAARSPEQAEIEAEKLRQELKERGTYQRAILCGGILLP